MSDDLSQFLSGWPLDPGRINARRIIGDDERPKLQIRIDLGVLQMEFDGRPDGTRPEGYESVLALQRHRLQQYEHVDAGGPGFALSAEECADLREEAMQIYHRYVALFSLGEVPLVVRDTSHILEAHNFCRDYGPRDEPSATLISLTASALAMRARAEAEMAVAAGQPKDALAAIDRGLGELRAHFQDSGRGGDFDSANETLLLRGMREMLVPKLPASQRAELRERLRAALDAENYELAAILRDELRMMKD